MSRIRLVGPLALFAATAVAQTPLVVTGLPAKAPLSITASATATALRVDLALEPEWHVYARDVGGGQPVSLSLAADCGFVATGPQRLPPDDGGKLHGRVHVELAIAARGAGGGGDAGALRATLALQVCDPLMCLPPMSIAIAGEVPAAAAFPVLLVVDVKDERAARIEAFLQQRGFAVAVTTYADVAAADCERAAVVVADSKLFGKTAKVRDKVLQFPKTTTPVVAVGFFGTELVEAHGVAMTSGYI